MKINYDKLNALMASTPQKGFEGKKNVWICERCRKAHICIDIDKGVTPFIIQCQLTPACKGKAYSCFYHAVTDLSPEFEWYRPKPEDNYEANSAAIDHIERGGLIMRKITKH